MNFLSESLFVPIVAAVLALIGVIVLFIVAKRDQIISHKKILLVSLLGALTLALPATLALLELPYIPTVFIFSAAYSLVMGCLYLLYYPNMLAKPSQEQWWMCFFILVVTALMGAAFFVIIFHFVSDIKYGLMASYPTAFIFIPFVFKYTLDALLDIPIEIYKVWYYHEEEKTNWFDDDFSRMFVFEVELYKKTTDLHLTTIKAKAPDIISFDDWFQRFLDDYNKKNPQKPIECAQHDGEYFGWVFYVKPLFWPVKRYVDFEKTIAENEIRGRHTIVAKRVVESKEEYYDRQVLPEDTSMVETVDGEPVEQTEEVAPDTKKDDQELPGNIPGSGIARVIKQTPEQMLRQGEGNIQSQITNRIPKL